MGTKQLRLDPAQLTDVGRRREHNEDNMAYVIPKDQQVMARKGALFIVADGMGGHAAGEVASEIAVDTVSNMYYQDDSDDIADSLLHSIKRANALIHQRAAENMLRSGMGTTCVAAVLRGNMAYIANVGDSRAYLVRSGQIKQVSQDHSWVAEQVRAGLLTEDQARTHAQRNVITRCLGTQAEVEIDVFPEQLEEKDVLVLCTDGLSGLVSDEDIRRIVDQSGPQESVYHLVERANENGGSDNITAIVVYVPEIGSEPPNARHPVYVGGRETGEDTALMGMTSNSPGLAAPAIFSDGTASSSDSLRYTSGPLVSPDSITAPQPVVKIAPKRRRNRLLYPTLALLLLLVLAGLAGGGYYYLHASSSLADQRLQNAKELINTANREVSTNPSVALQDLASAQSTLRPLLTELLSTTQHNKLMNLLQGELPVEVKKAITSYNAHENITTLPCPHMPSPALLNEGTTGTQAKSIVAVQGKNGTSLLYALGQDNKVYQVTNNSLIPFSLPVALTTAHVLDIASYGSQLVILTAQPSTKGASTNYALALLSPDQKKVQQTAQINPNLLTNGQTPKLIAVSFLDVYVVIASDSSQATVLDFAPNKVHQPLSVALTSTTFSVSATIVSMAAFPQNQLFFLLADGSVKNLVYAGSQQEVTSVFVQQTLAQPLALSASDFTWQKTVPVPPVIPTGIEALNLPGASSPRTLVAALVNTAPHLYVLDAVSHRVLDLQVVGAANPPATNTQTPTNNVTPTSTSAGGGVVTSATPVNLQLARQYVSSNLLAGTKSMTVDPQGSQVTVVTQTQQNSSSLSLVSFSTSSQNGCV